MPGALLRGPPDGGVQQVLADPAALRLLGHGQRPDLGLVRPLDNLARLRPGLEHDRPQDGIVLDGDDHGARAIGAQGPQPRGVRGGLGQEAVGPVGRHPQVANLGQLAGTGIANDHSVRYLMIS